MNARALHESVHGDVPHLPKLSEDEAYAWHHGRASDKLKESDFELERHLFLPNWHSLGTPGEASLRREEIFAKVCRGCFAGILGLLVLYSYYHFIEPKQPLPSNEDMHYRQRAKRLATAKSIYLTDPYENCLVGMHKDATGSSIVNTHC